MKNQITHTGKQIGLALMAWHGGGGSALYALGSTMFAEHSDTVTDDMIAAAIVELKHEAQYRRNNGNDGDVAEIGNIIAVLDAWRKNRTSEDFYGFVPVKASERLPAYKTGWFLVYREIKNGKLTYERVTSWTRYNTREQALLSFIGLKKTDL